VPAHDAADFEFARAHNLTPIVVLDPEGTVVEGPLAGLTRYAARSQATDLLVAEAAIGDGTDVDEAVARCRRCGTVLVPRLGAHWFLPMTDLEVLAADAVRQGTLTVGPPAMSDELIAAAGQRGDWCLSHQVWAGQPVPVARCLDCGNLAVSTQRAESCGKCMGTLVPDDDVLDARFVGAVWPLAVAGWPADPAAPASTAADTILVIAPTGLVLWAVRMAALSLRLTGTPPFGRVVVHPPVDQPSQLDAAPTDVVLDVDDDWIADILSAPVVG
jgi:valyl-tRNA synthetase